MNFCEFSKNTFSIEHLRTTASEKGPSQMFDKVLNTPLLLNIRRQALKVFS